MLEARPLVVDESMIVLGGNMRLKALKSSGIFEVPIYQVTGWSEEQKNEFIIKDNVGFGEWDYDILANEWSAEALIKWGLVIPEPYKEDDFNDISLDTEEKEDKLCPHCGKAL